MRRKLFTLSDIEAECRVETCCHSLDGRAIVAVVRVPSALHNRYPYNATADRFLQQLRQSIFEFGTIEFPRLPVNKSNYTVAMRHPHQHGNSDNPYLTRFCQDPHQDTPPYPTAFWLGAPRRYSATRVMSRQGLQD